MKTYLFFIIVLFLFIKESISQSDSLILSKTVNVIILKSASPPPSETSTLAAHNSSTINSAIELLKGQGTIIVEKGYYKIIKNSIPDAITVKMSQGAIFEIIGTGTIFLSKNFTAGLYQVFAGNKKVIFDNIKEVYPEWFGAKSDSLTDNTDAIRACVNSFLDGTVRFSPGLYLTQCIYYKSNISFIGSKIDVTTIKLANDSNSPLFSRADAYLHDDWPLVNNKARMSNINISDMTLDGNRINQSFKPDTSTWNWMIYFQRIDSGKIERVKEINGSDGGIILNHSKNITVNECIVLDCSPFPSARNGITSFRSFTYSHNGHSLDVENFKGGNIIKNCYVINENGGGYTISAEYTFGDSIINNNCIGAILGMESAHNAVLKGNYLTNGSISVSNTDGFPVLGTLIEDNNINKAIKKTYVDGAIGVGISVYNIDNCIISNNTISDSFRIGGKKQLWGMITLGACPNSIIRNNIIRTNMADSTVVGLLLHSSPNARITGNEINIYKAVGIYISYGSDGITITNNTINQISSPANSYGIGLQSNPVNTIVCNNMFRKFNYTIVNMESAGTTNGLKTIYANNLVDSCINTVYEITQGDIIYGLIKNRRIYYNSHYPVSGAWNSGDITFNSFHFPGSEYGWICTKSGVPGIWELLTQKPDLSLSNSSEIIDKSIYELFLGTK